LKVEIYTDDRYESAMHGISNRELKETQKIVKRTGNVVYESISNRELKEQHADTNI